MAGPSRRRWTWVLILLVVGAIALWLCVGGIYGLTALLWGHNPTTLVPATPERSQETMRRADQIVAALERWRARNGEYPASLDQLVPAELPAIPESVVGDRKWKYSRIAPDHFVLEFFEGPIYEGSSWDSARGSWYVDG